MVLVMLKKISDFIFRNQSVEEQVSDVIELFEIHARDGYTVQQTKQKLEKQLSLDIMGKAIHAYRYQKSI